jgi:hypothetical protein
LVSFKKIIVIYFLTAIDSGGTAVIVDRLPFKMPIGGYKLPR